jgi:hypothetical protein
MRSPLFASAALALTVAVSGLAAAQSPGASSATPYWQSAQTSCAYVGSYGQDCWVDFAIVPAQRRLEITNVSCLSINEEAPALPVLRYSQLWVYKGVTPRKYSILDPRIGSAGQAYQLNHPVTAFAEAGERFRVRTNFKQGKANMLIDIQCHVSGLMLKLI